MDPRDTFFEPLEEKDALELLREGKELLQRLLVQAERLKKDNELLMARCLHLREENENLRHLLDEGSERMLEMQVRALQAESELLSLKSRVMHAFGLSTDRELSRFLLREEEDSNSRFQA